MTDDSQSVKVYATEDEADALYIRRAETDAKGIAMLLGLTVQRIYQLEKKGVIARTGSGNFNISDTISGYLFYDLTGEVLPPAPVQGKSNGFFMDITERNTVNAAELAAMLGVTPTHIERLTLGGILKQKRKK